MYLTQDQASIALYQESKLTEREIKQELDNLKSHSSGQYAVLLSTGCKLKYDANRDLFWVCSYHYSEFDVVYIYDSLEMIDDYWEFLSDCLHFSDESIENRKKGYLAYKTSIEYKAA
jgi:hypothetical protein